MSLIISNKGSTEDYVELARVPDLVKKCELVLNAISARNESAQYLDEFITIINNAALYMGEVKNDIDNTIVVAGALLSQLHYAISEVPTGVLLHSRDGIKPSLFAELSATILAAGKANAPKESTVTWASEKKQSREEEAQEQAVAPLA
jgi:hypothetical protein